MPNIAEDLSPEDLKVFLEEAEEQLQLLDEEVVRLEKESTEDRLAAIFRAAHTLKGSSAMIDYKAMAEVAHAMESLLDKLRKGSISVTPEVVDALLHSLDALRVLTEELANPTGVEVDFESLVAELDASVATQTGESAPAKASGSAAQSDLAISDEVLAELQDQLDSGRMAYRITAKLQEDSAFGAVRFFQVHAELGECGKILVSSPTEAQIQEEQIGDTYQAMVATDLQPSDIQQRLVQVEDIASVDVSPFDAAADATPVPAPAAAEAQEKTAPAEGDRKTAAAQTVRIDVERLDHLMNLIGELVIDRTRIQQIGRSLLGKYEHDDLVTSLGKTSAHIVKVVDDLQEDFMKVRMMPISTVFNSFPRMMRDLSRKLEKPIDFQISGGETEIDRTVIERIRDPLVHMLRNALDHGLESTEDRKKSGKDETGVIKLEAYHEQGHIVIKVKDDGGGMDPQKLRDSFTKKGLISREAASRLSDTEALELIFMAGASTKEQATEVSGRGVGMDIVKQNIEAINGFVDVQSVVGKGTEFTLRLPLTLATVNSILVMACGTLCAIPLVYVLEAVKLQAESIKTVQGREVFRLRDKVIPLISLADATGMKSENATYGEDGRHVVVVRVGERLAGLAVEELLEPQEIVVKSLGKYVGDIKGVTGASILGDGRVVLILDVGSLIATAVARGRKLTAEQIESAELPQAA